MRGFSALWHGFQMFSTVVEKSAQSFAMIMLYGMWGLMTVNAISRWLGVNVSVAWSLEIVGYMIVWTIFVMIGPVAKWDAHIRMNFIPMKLFGENRGISFMRMAENLTALGICLYMTIHAYRWIDMTKDMGLEARSVADWYYPLWIIRLAILVGFILICLFYFERTVNWIVNFITQKGKTSMPGNGEVATSEIQGVQISTNAK